jgi:hypothetical protein
MMKVKVEIKTQWKFSRKLGSLMEIEQGITMTSPITAKSLNKACACQTLDSSLLQKQLEEMFDDITLNRPNLFSSTAVFVSSDEVRRIQDIISSVEEVIALPLFQKEVLSISPFSADSKHGPHGVFMGYDFHLSERGPQLIEINTNAGGALLNIELARAQIACCSDMMWNLDLPHKLGDMEKALYEMFLKEWHTQRDAPLRSLAIVDTDPLNQYLYPEFRLFQNLFLRFGIKTFIADPKELSYRNGKLLLAEEEIDMVYNRLTDFYLMEPTSKGILDAYQSEAIVLTPNPHHHALYANKFNLITLSSGEKLARLGVSEESRGRLISGIPKTIKVSPDNIEELWKERKSYFFKPNSGFGSKATYRGDKLTHRVWNEIIQGEYVAQEIAPPSQRVISLDGKKQDLKLDLRAYVYQGSVQLLASRLYSGQTTNFRTPGGGFAPVFIAPE